MATLRSLSKKLKDALSQATAPDMDSKTYKVLDTLDRYNKSFSRPENIKVLPNLDQSKIRNIPLNATAGVAEYLVNEPRKQISDIGTGLNKIFTGQSQNFEPNSDLFKLFNNVTGSLATGQNPLLTVRIKGSNGNKFGYGGGTMSIPFTNKKFAEMGFSESPAAQMTGQALNVIAPFAAVKGAAKPLGVGAYTALGGGLNAGVARLGGDKDYKKNLIAGANESSRKAAAFTGFSNMTNPLLEGIGGKAVTRLPLKSGANVAQGVALDRVSDQETTGLSLALDALFPIAGEVGGKSYESAGKAMKDVEIKINSALGRKLRNNKGLYTTAEKFAKGTRAYRKKGGDKLNGVALGFEPYQDEDGSWKVRFNRERALVGLGIGLGMTKGVSNGNYKDLADSLNRTQFKNLDQATKDAVLEEAQRMLAGGIGDTGVIGNARYSANPDWYRDFYKQTGKAPSNEEFFDMALSRVKPQQGFDNVEDILKSFNESGLSTKTTQSPELPDTAKVSQFIESVGNRPYMSGLPLRWMYKDTAGNPVDVPTDIAKLLTKAKFDSAPSLIKPQVSQNLYHTTQSGNIESIAREGLSTGKKPRFGGVSSPNKISFSANEAAAKYYGTSDDVMLRTKKGFKPKDLEVDMLAGGEGTYLTSKNIPPEALEIKVNGEWKPLIGNTKPAEIASKEGVNASKLPLDELSAQLTKSAEDNAPKNSLEDRSFEEFIKKIPTPLSKKVSLLDYLRTPENVLKKIGLEKEAQALKNAHSAYLDELPKEMGKVTEWYNRVPSPESAVNIFRSLDGKLVDLSPEEKQVAGEIKQYLAGWAGRLKLPTDRRITNYITHIFDEQLIKKEFDEDLAKILDNKVAGSVYDPFTLERLGAMGYKENVWDALDAYVKRGVRKANMDSALEKVGKAADNLELSQFNYVKRYVDRINMRPTEVDNLLDNTFKHAFGYRFGGRPTARISKFARQMVYRGTLGLNVGSALRNLTQGVNTYSELGEKYTILGYTNLLKNGTKELDEEGLFRNGMVEDRSLNATKKFWENTDKVLFSLFELAERINRGSAYYGAKAKGLSMGMTEEQARKYAVDIVAKTQFTFGKIDTPVALQSDIAKLLTQFQSYNIKQLEFLGGKVRNKDIAGLARYSIGSFVMLQTIGQLLGMDWKDLIPSVKIGASPVFSGTRDIIQSITGGEDAFGNELTPEERLSDAGKAVIPFIPAGVQGKKSLGAAIDLSRGYTQTASGRIKSPVEQTPSNIIKGLAFGTRTLPEVRENRDNPPLSMKQSEQVKNSDNRSRTYNMIQGKRKQDANIKKIKDEVSSTGQEKNVNGTLYYPVKTKDKETGEEKVTVKTLKIREPTSEELYSGLDKKYETSSDSPNNIIKKIMVYGTGVFKDPEGVLNAVKSGQPIRKVRGDAVVLERLRNLSSIDNGDKETQVDHIIAVALGGDNSKDNLQIISKQDNAAKGIVDTYLAKELKAGNISKEEAQSRDLRWRDEIANLPKADKEKAEAILSKEPEKRQIREVTKVTPLGSYVVTNKTTGKKTIIDLSEPIEKPKLSGLTELDKGLISKYNSAISTRINNIEKVYLDGQITAEEAEKAILELKDSKITNKKGKKAKKGGVKVSSGKKAVTPIKIRSTETSIPKSLKIKSAPVSKIKVKKAKPIKITRKVAKNKPKPIKFRNTLADNLTKLV